MAFSLELGEEISNITCDCCGGRFKSVGGIIKKDDDACWVYFATLHTGHTDIMVGLTVSIGKWWDDTAFDGRHWILLTVKPSEWNFNMRIEEPEALASDLKDELCAVADYVVVEDPSNA